MLTISGVVNEMRSVCSGTESNEFGSGKVSFPKTNLEKFLGAIQACIGG